MLGSTGFLGRHIAPALRAAGHTVITTGRSPEVDIPCPVLDLVSLAQVVRDSQPEAIVNLLGAGLSHPTADTQTMDLINTSVPLLLARSISAANPEIHLIHAASSTEDSSDSGDFESEYSRTKAAGTRALLDFAQNSSQPVSVLRIHNTYGSDQPGRRFFASIVDSCLAGETVRLNYPNRIRDFIHVDDVAAAFVGASQQLHPGIREFEVGTGTGASLSEVAGMIATEAGESPDLILDSPHADRHPATVANSDRLIRPASITLAQGIRSVVRDRREGDVHT